MSPVIHPAPTDPPPVAPPDYEELLPVGVQQLFLSRIEEESVAIQMGRTLRMAQAQESMPIVAFQPQAGWVENPYAAGEDSRKPITEVRWSVVKIRPQEVAAVVPIPNAWIMDAGFDVEGQVVASLSTAMAHAIDQAIFWGEGAPTGFPPDGVVGFAEDATGADALEAISNGMTELEENGIQPTGIVGGPSIGAALRAAYTNAQALPGVAPAPTIFGLPVRIVWNWDTAAGGNAIIGGFDFLVIAMRENVTFGRSTEGVLYDDTGQLVTSAFQDNVTLVKTYARLGAAIGTPAKPGPGDIDDVGVANPFVKVTW